MPTVGADLKTTQVGVDGAEVGLQIWDTAGSERFRSLIPMYFRNSRFVILVYSVTDGINLWLELIAANCSDPAPLSYLVGNKTDLESSRTVTFDEGSQRADLIHAPFFEVSAKLGYNIAELFQHIARKVMNQAEPSQPDRVEISGEVENTHQWAGEGGQGSCC